MSHPIDPRHLAEGKQAADQMMEAAFGRTGVSPETTEGRLLKCMRRTENAEAEVKRLRAVVTDLEQDRADLVQDRDRYREHSITLNSVAFAIAEALGDVPEGADTIVGNPIEQAARLIARAERHRIELRDAHNDLLDVRGVLAPAGYPDVTPLPLVPTVAPAVQWLVDRLAAVEQDRDRLSDELDQAAPVLLAVAAYAALFQGDHSQTSGSVLQLLTAWTRYRAEHIPIAVGSSAADSNDPGLGVGDEPSGEAGHG